MRKLVTLFVAFIPLCAVAQSAPPDTLLLELKGGKKMILIGNDLDSFRKVNTDSLIRNALGTVSDSLSKPATAATAPLVTNIKGKELVVAVKYAIGVGLIRDRLSPCLAFSLDFAPQRADYNRVSALQYTFINLALNTYCFFEKDGSGSMRTLKNSFFELSIGNRINNRVKEQGLFDEFAFGLGYMNAPHGSFLKKHQFKAFIMTVPVHSFLKFNAEWYVLGKDSFPGSPYSAVFRSGRLFLLHPFEHHQVLCVQAVPADVVLVEVE